MLQWTLCDSRFCPGRAWSVLNRRRYKCNTVRHCCNMFLRILWCSVVLQNWHAPFLTRPHTHLDISWISVILFLSSTHSELLHARRTSTKPDSADVGDPPVRMLLVFVWWLATRLVSLLFLLVSFSVERVRSHSAYVVSLIPLLSHLSFFYILHLSCFLFRFFRQAQNRSQACCQCWRLRSLLPLGRGLLKTWWTRLHAARCMILTQIHPYQCHDAPEAEHTRFKRSTFSERVGADGKAATSLKTIAFWRADEHWHRPRLQQTS